MERGEHGDYDSRVLGLRVGTREGSFGEMGGAWVRWIGEDGQPLPFSREHAAIARARADEERARADEERARADKARARADALAARVVELEAQLAARKE